MIALAHAGSVQPQLSDVPRIWAQLIAFHALDDVRQHGIGAAREADLLALAHHEAVEKFDLRAPAFLHILAHGGTLLGGGVLAVLEALLIAGAHRRLVALSRTRYRLWRQVQNLLPKVCEPKSQLRRGNKKLLRREHSYIVIVSYAERCWLLFDCRAWTRHRRLTVRRPLTS